MAIVNRTPDSFYRPGITWDESAAMDRVHQVVAEGADIIDIGGVPAAPGSEVDAGEEIRRTAGFIAAVRAAYPDVVISSDTWRHEVGREVCAAGADLLNDSWGGLDTRLAEVAAEFGAGLVCAHAGPQPPRTRPFRVAYADVMADVLDRTLALAARAARAGVDPARIVIDPAHDFGKNTWHSLEVTRRLAEMTATGWPVLVSLSNKDFVGETLNVPPEERLPGTLASTAICAWLGARIFRVHQVLETRQVLDMVVGDPGRPAAGPRGAGAGLADDHRCRAVPGAAAAGPRADRRRPGAARAARGVPPGRRRAAGQPAGRDRGGGRGREDRRLGPGRAAGPGRLRPDARRGRRAARAAAASASARGCWTRPDIRGAGSCSRSARTTRRSGAPSWARTWPGGPGAWRCWSWPTAARGAGGARRATWTSGARRSTPRWSGRSATATWKRCWPSTRSWPAS